MRVSVLFACVAAAATCMPDRAWAQLAPRERCQNLAASIVLTMKTYRDIGQARDVALDQAGFAEGSARHRVAARAYQLLDAGTAPDAVIATTRTECLRLGPDALEGGPVYGEGGGDGDEGASASQGPPVCGDVASAVAALLFDDPAMRTAPIDEALWALRSSDPRDMPTPELRRLLELARERTRGGIDERALQSVLFRDCATADAARRNRLKHEFYVP